MSVTPINSKLFKAVSASTTAIAIAQTLGGAGNLNLVSSSVSDGSNMDTTVTLTSTGNISGVTFTVTGTDASGSTITEDIISVKGNIELWSPTSMYSPMHSINFYKFNRN